MEDTCIDKGSENTTADKSDSNSETQVGKLMIEGCEVDIIKKGDSIILQRKCPNSEAAKNASRLIEDMLDSKEVVLKPPKIVKSES